VCKTALWAVVVFAAISAAAAEEVPAVGDEAPPAPDLAGYRLCPECNTLNPRIAEYCMRCGAGLVTDAGPAGISKAAAVRRFVLAPMVSTGTPNYLGPRAQARFDWGRFAYEPAYAYYVIDDWEGRYNDGPDPHYLENLFRTYFGSARLRPSAAVDLRFQYRCERLPYRRSKHYFELTPTAGGGVNVNYDERGSFLEASAGFGVTSFWTSSDRNVDTRAAFVFDVENVTFVKRNLGIWARATVLTRSADFYYYADNVFLLNVGPAFSW
jgi:hypothetical protein